MILCSFLNLFSALPPSAPPPTVKKRRVSKYSTSRSEEDHVTGCARSEGYYKIDMRDKVKYLPHHRLKNSTSAAESKKSVSLNGCGLNWMCIVVSRPCR